jgi:hypothetical protein
VSEQTARDLLESLLVDLRQAVEAAPHLDPQTRQALGERVTALEGDLGQAGAGAEGRVLLQGVDNAGEVYARLRRAVDAGYQTESARLEENIQEWEPKLRRLEEKAWAHKESHLYGGRGAGTLTLLCLTLAFFAGLFIGGVTAVLIVAAAVLLSTVVWCVFNLILGPDIQKPYMDVLTRTKELWRSRQALDQAYRSHCLKRADLERRLREVRRTVERAAGAPKG